MGDPNTSARRNTTKALKRPEFPTMAIWHLTDEMIETYASGSISEGMSLLAAAHLTYCPACRAEVEALEKISGVVLAECDVSGDGPDLAAVLEAIEAEPGPEARPAPLGPDEDSPLPNPVRERLGAPIADLRWRFLLPGLAEFRLEGFENEEVSLLRARPGVRIPGHTHSGDEATLILSGQMRDGNRVFRRGDLAFADHHDDHHPEIVGNETCVCLVVLSGRMRFTGPLGRALNLFTG
jgi:putative transcriptional regulator